jgi:uncharacterized protein (DUF1697 family)
VTAALTATRQVAFLRGINVGRNNRVAMARLRELVTGLGYTDVATHLQSGNVLVTSTHPADRLARDVAEVVARELGLQLGVVARTRDGLAEAVECCDGITGASDPTRLLVDFLSAAPDPARLDGLDPATFAPDEFRLLGRELYLWCPDGLLASPLSKVPWEKRLGVVATMRNQRTVTRLLELLDG